MEEASNAMEEISNEMEDATIEETNSTLSLLYHNIHVIGVITTFIPFEDILSTLPLVCKSINYLTIPIDIINMQRCERPHYWDCSEWSCNFIEDIIFKIKYLIRKNEKITFNQDLLVSLSIDNDICLDKILKSLKFLTQLGSRMEDTCNICDNDLDIVITRFSGMNEIRNNIFNNDDNDNNGMLKYLYLIIILS